MNQKKRIDQVLVDKGMAESRQRAKSMIMAGLVQVDKRRVDKPGTPVAANAVIDVKSQDHPYVSRGGIKLQVAVDHFKIDVNNLVCMDIGASTGGFTDCLLQKGADLVFAVDVGYGQLAWKLRQDPRVVVIERTNIRYLPSDAIPNPVDLISVDVSFISLKIVIPAALQFLKKTGHILALIKPQFEVGKGKVGKGGVVRDTGLHEAVIQDLTSFFAQNGLSYDPVIPSPIRGPKGNREFLIHLYFNKKSP